VVRYPTHNLRELVPVPDQYNTATEGGTRTEQSRMCKLSAWSWGDQQGRNPFPAPRHPGSPGAEYPCAHRRCSLAVLPGARLSDRGDRAVPTLSGGSQLPVCH
jgi:hypothetical protein